MAAPVIIAGLLDLPIGWTVHAHRHSHPELILVTRGALTADVGGEAIAAGTGDAFVHPPGVLHRERNAGPEPLGLAFLIADFDPVPRGRLVDRDGRLRLLLRWLADDQSAGAPPEALAGWLAAIRAHLPRCAVGEGAIAGPTRARLRAQLGRAHGVGALARACGLGARQFLRRYREETRSTPMADLRRMRCEAAAELLVTTDWTLARIAAEVGFCDAFHLSKAFQRRFGAPPSSLRRHGRG